MVLKKVWVYNATTKEGKMEEWDFPEEQAPEIRHPRPASELQKLKEQLKARGVIDGS